MSRAFASLVVVATILLALPSPTLTTPGTDWRSGDLFVGVGDLAFKESKGKYALLGEDGSRRIGTVVDKNRGYTTGCAVEPATGHLWTTSFDGNTISEFDDLREPRGEHPLLRTINVRPYTVVNGKARGAVGSLAFDANGNLYAGTSDGTNRLLKFSADGFLLDSYALPAASGGIAWFDLATDQHTIYYTSPLDTVVRRYDVAARAPLPDLATLIDGTIYALRLLPNDQGLLVAGSAGISRLDLAGTMSTRYWLPGTQFYSLNIAADGKTFWTSSAQGQLFRFDIASETLVAGPIATGFRTVHGLCVKDEYVAAEDTCRTTDAAGESMQAMCALLEHCSNQTDDDGDGAADGADLDCQIPGRLHELPPPAPLQSPLPTR
jgi:streptogramin lyase